MSQEENFNLDKITYSESRTINMGDYESTQCFFSFSTIVKDRLGGKKSLTIREKSSEQVTNSDVGTFTKTAKRCMKRVKDVLDEQELILRKTCIEHDFSDDDEAMTNKYNALLTKKKKEKVKSK